MNFFKPAAASVAASIAPSKSPWKVIIVDDDQAIHDITVMALDGFTFDDRPLAFVHAYSGAQAVEAVRAHPGAALLLLDVVMEREHAGLEAVRVIREQLGNTMIRIVLRTGQPGSAPEEEIIRRYDINDYKEKTELTARKLFTLMHAGLRNYRDLATIERSRSGLAKIIDAAPSIFNPVSFTAFAKGALEQLAAVSRADDDAIVGNVVTSSGIALEGDQNGIHPIASTGRFAAANDPLAELSPDIKAMIRSRRSSFDQGHLLEIFRGDDKDRFLYLEGVAGGNDIDRNLIQVFLRNLSVAFENIRLREEIESTQREIVFRLGEAVETRSRDTGSHVKRVAEMSFRLAQAVGLSEAECELIRYASPLHDVGKIGIADHILAKPGKLTPDEWSVMKDHTLIGWRMLKDARQPVLQAAATIALEHHERWDGNGYPRGLAGSEIDPRARIVGLADCFDALASHRPYKAPWPLERITAYLADERGRHFDPALVDLALPLAPELYALRQKWPDGGPSAGLDDKIA